MPDRLQLAFCDLLRTNRLFEPGTEVVITRAPGRLDVMGGIADYSGSLVLQRPITEATFVAARRIERPVVEIVSRGRAACTIPLADLAPGGEPIDYEVARHRFKAGDEAAGRCALPRWPHWASYVVGPFLVLAGECRLVPSGVRLVIDSQVPEGKGVSSSAALETAVMQALATLFDIAVEPYKLALMCQRSENLISDAACGVMDQMTCVFGERDRLMALLCQPALLQPFVTVPDDITFWGLDSGERHTVGASDYASVRTAAFMGLRMLAVDQGRSERYLADLPLTDFERDLAHTLPERMPGREFHARYGPHVDTVTRVDADQSYLVRTATAHPVYERQRAELFRRLLSESSDEERRVHLGTLMYESHASYQACGLGSPGTNRLVELVRREGAAAGLYGARITGGGSGGTVVVMGRSDAAAAIARVSAAYEGVSGYRPHVFAGSSSGVAAFGAARVSL